jgi:hypothetical protein
MIQGVSVGEAHVGEAHGDEGVRQSLSEARRRRSPA